MIEFKENFGLRKYNTFGINIEARFFVEIKSDDAINKLLQSGPFLKYQRLIIGGGSNILFTKNFEGLVIHPQFKGIKVVDENDKEVFIKVGSGVVWDKLVEHTVKNEWGGLENLSDIPGNVGASPIQNIGAYGVEVAQIIDSVEGIDLNSGERLKFSKLRCEFTYRNSIFKKKYRNSFLITYVTFRLSKPPHQLVTHYGIIEHELRKYRHIGIATVREVVSKIRKSKLPRTDITGNAGSFFKNPEVSEDIAHNITSKHTDAPAYKTDSEHIKLSAAWLIDHSNCKGIRIGNAGTHDTQPLVLINMGNATGREIQHLAEYVQQKVYENFGVNLEPEVNII